MLSNCKIAWGNTLTCSGEEFLCNFFLTDFIVIISHKSHIDTTPRFAVILKSCTAWESWHFSPQVGFLRHPATSKSVCLRIHVFVQMLFWLDSHYAQRNMPGHKHWSKYLHRKSIIAWTHTNEHVRLKIKPGTLQHNLNIHEHTCVCVRYCWWISRRWSFDCWAETQKTLCVKQNLGGGHLPIDECRLALAIFDHFYDCTTKRGKSVNVADVQNPSLNRRTSPIPARLKISLLLADCSRLLHLKSPTIIP